MKSRLQGSDIEIYSTNDEGMSNVGERFIIILKNKIYKCITSTSKNVYIDKLHIKEQLEWSLLILIKSI